MKRTFDVFTLVAILVALILIPLISSEADLAYSPVVNLGVRFANFPMNKVRTVQLDWGGFALESDIDRQKTDQILDWLLIAITSDAGLAPSQLSEAMWDLPPARSGSTGQVADFEYGATRSRPIGNGEIIALIPANSAKRTELLNHIADDQRTNLGQIPKTLFVFEYVLSPTVSITRREIVDGQSLFTATSGYHELTVRDKAGFQEFLSNVDDLTLAELRPDGLLLGGRKTGDTFRRIDLDDMGALWQSQSHIQQTLSEISAFDQKWNSVTYSTPWEKASLEAKYDEDKSDLEKKLGHAATSESGFSLDPAYDFAGLERMFDAFAAGLPSIPAGKVVKVKRALRDQDVGPLFELFDEISKDPNGPLQASLAEAQRHSLENLPAETRISIKTGFLDELIHASTFQMARYDGALQGTQVGMSLFYTDLLAKLKAIDFWHSPDVSNFQSLTEVRLSRVYKAELEQWPSTRLWFGPRSKGFQLTAKNIIFARIATRVYAASSSTLAPGKEVEPNAESSQFLGWWNDHYEEIAQSEPEYQRLNEIMKWSLLVGWLFQRDQGSALGFLNQVQVDKSNWFPDWARANPHLRYQDWERVKFWPRGYKTTRTEAMPLLHSAAFEPFGDDGHYIEGGVSLGSAKAIAERPMLSEALENDLRLRAGVDFSPEATQSSNSIRTLDKITHVFREDEGLLETVSTARTEAKFRSPFGDIRNSAVTRDYFQSSSKLEIAVSVGEKKLGTFHSDVSGGEIRIGFQALDIDQGQTLAERLSSAVARQEDLDNLLESDLRVQFAVKMDCEGCYLVKLRGSEGWLKLAPEQSPSSEIGAGWDARVAGFDPHAQNYNLAWIDNQRLANEFSQYGYVRIRRASGNPRNFPLEVTNRGPPVNTKEVELSLNGSKIKALETTDGVAYAAREQIPSDLLNDPQKLAASILSPNENVLVRDLRTQNYDDAVRKIAEDPIAAKKQLNEIATLWLREADESLLTGDDSAAQWKLSNILNLRGALPDLLARRAIADLQVPGLAVSAVEESLRSPVRTPESLFAIMSGRSSRLGATADEKHDLSEFAEMIDFRLQQVHSRLSGEIRPLIEEGHLAFHYRLSEQVHGTTVSAQEAGKDGPIYVLDSPSLHNVDWQLPIAINHPEAVSAEIIKLPRWDLAQDPPDVIETPNGNYRLTKRTFQIPYQPLKPAENQDCQDPQSTNDLCRRSLYLVTPRGSE